MSFVAWCGVNGEGKEQEGVDRWTMVAFLCDMGETVAERLGKVSEWVGE